MKNNDIFSADNGNLDQLAKAVDISPDLFKKMMDEAELAKNNTYSPYSKFPVGCALLTSKGAIVRGTNVENMAYGSSICAERSAICSSVSNGEKSFKLYVVTSNLEDFLTPCGACRQFIVEFGEVNIILMNVKRQCKLTSIEELLPTKAEISHLKK